MGLGNCGRNGERREGGAVMGQRGFQPPWAGGPRSELREEVGRVRVGLPGTQPELCSRPQGRARGGAGMVLPSKEPRRGPGQPAGRPQCRVLAERNQSGAAVAVWVESAPGQQSPAFVSAPRAPSAGA